MLNIPYRREAARYFSRFFNYDFALERALRTDILNSAGAIQSRMAMPFNNHLWIGNHKVGAEWSAETNKLWSNLSKESMLEIIPESGVVTLRVNIVDQANAKRLACQDHRVSDAIAADSAAWL